jgi:hypothetical protein
MKQNKEKNPNDHPYENFENTPLWTAFNNSLAELEQNQDIEITTRKELVIGYICKQHRDRLKAVEKKLLLNALNGLDRLSERHSEVIDFYALIFASSIALTDTEYSDLFKDAANNLEKIALSEQEEEVKRDQALFVTNRFRTILAGIIEH